jgi:hypothetical protein
MKNLKTAPPAVHKKTTVPALLSVNADAKTSKGNAAGYLTGICYLAPANVAGLGNLCPHSSQGCRDACLFTAGRAAIFKAINLARIARTRLLFSNRKAFQNQLIREIEALMRKADREGFTPCVRLNGTSDLSVESLFPEIFERFPMLQLYDYTKNLSRVLKWAAGKLPRNYHLTFSLSETNADKALQALQAGVNVCAVVDDPKAFTEGFTLYGQTFKTFDADGSDIRFLDKPAANGHGRVGILKAKGKARKDATGFVIRSC